MNMNLTALRDSLGTEGPFATVHLDASHDTEDAAKVDDLRWRSVREELSGQDVPERTIGALDNVRDRPPPAGRAGRLIVAAGGDVLVDEYLPAPPAQPMVRVSAVPYLLPLADWTLREVPHVVVAVDRIGADLRASDAAGMVRTEDVEGRDHPVHKVGGGGWAHRSLQQRAEETVRRNLADVAAETARLVREVDAELLILAGDPEPRAQLRDALPEPCRRIAVEIDHNRQADPSHHTVEREVADLLARRRHAWLTRTLDRFHEAGGLAVQGLPDTVAALREANVAVLLIDARAVGDATVWAGTPATAIAQNRDDLHRIGVSERLRLRADEALPAAALAGGADIVAATGDDPPLELTGGVGAILRHT